MVRRRAGLRIDRAKAVPAGFMWAVAPQRAAVALRALGERRDLASCSTLYCRRADTRRGDSHTTKSCCVDQGVFVSNAGEIVPVVWATCSIEKALDRFSCFCRTELDCHRVLRAALRISVNRPGNRLTSPADLQSLTPEATRSDWGKLLPGPRSTCCWAARLRLPDYEQLGDRPPNAVTDIAERPEDLFPLEGDEEF